MKRVMSEARDFSMMLYRRWSIVYRLIGIFLTKQLPDK